jgi:hypothetical protein
MQEELAVLKPGLEAAMGESEALMERVAREKREVVEPKKEIVDRDVRAADAKVCTSTAQTPPMSSYLTLDFNRCRFQEMGYSTNFLPSDSRHSHPRCSLSLDDAFSGTIHSTLVSVVVEIPPSRNLSPSLFLAT